MVVVIKVKVTVAKRELNTKILARYCLVMCGCCCCCRRRCSSAWWSPWWPSSPSSFRPSTSTRMETLRMYAIVKTLYSVYAPLLFWRVMSTSLLSFIVVSITSFRVQIDHYIVQICFTLQKQYLLYRQCNLISSYFCRLRSYICLVCKAQRKNCFGILTPYPVRKYLCFFLLTKSISEEWKIVWLKCTRKHCYSFRDWSEHAVQMMNNQMRYFCDGVSLIHWNYSPTKKLILGEIFCTLTLLQMIMISA